LKVVEPPKSGLLGRFKRLTSQTPFEPSGLAFADDLVSAVEARALWSRYGL
jgi:hypothetical protein